MGFDSSMTASCPRSAPTSSFPCIHFVYVSHCLSYQLEWRSLSSVKAVSCGCSVIPRNKEDVHPVFASMLLGLCCTPGATGTCLPGDQKHTVSSQERQPLDFVCNAASVTSLCLQCSGYEGQSWIIDASSSVYRNRISRLKARKWLSRLILICWWEVACFLSAMPFLIFV